MTSKLENNTWSDGQKITAIDSNDTNKAILVSGLTQTGMNIIRQLQDRAIASSADGVEGFADAYTDSNGRNNTVNGSTGLFDIDKMKALDTSSANLVYMDIYATSVNTVTLTDLANNVQCYRIDTNVWRMISYKGSVAEATNRLFNLLFYGSSTSPNGVTTLTDLRFSDATYQNKKVRYQTVSTLNGSGTHTARLDNLFSASTTYYYIADQGQAGLGGSGFARLKGPTVTNIHSVTSSGSWNDRDTSTIHTVSSTTTGQLECQNSGTGLPNGFSRTVVVYDAALTLTATPTTVGNGVTFESSDHTISATAPDIATYPIDEFVVFHDVPTGTFSATIDNLFGTTLVKDWETGANVQIKVVNATEDSGWLEINTHSGFTAFTSEPTGLLINLVPKSVSPTAGYPSINGYWAREL